MKVKEKKMARNVKNHGKELQEIKGQQRRNQ